jgi:L-threonylcarbamoyladenylate synthase
MVLDGGACRGGIESTVVAVAPHPRVLRRGLVSAQEISAALGVPVEDAPGQAPSAVAQSPGQLPVHYAPLAPARRFERAQWPAVLGGHDPARVVVLAFSELAAAGARVIRMPADPAAYAARLYAALREADALHPALILIEAVPGAGPLWSAIADRLARATHVG